MATKTIASKKLASKKTAKGNNKPAAKKVAKKYAKLKLTPIKVKARVIGSGKTERKVKPTKLAATSVAAMLTEETGLTRKDVNLVLNTLAQIAKGALMPKGVGAVAIPGLCVIKTRQVAAKKVPAIKPGTEVTVPGGGKKIHPGRKAYVKPATVKVRVVPAGDIKRAALGTE